MTIINQYVPYIFRIFWVPVIIGGFVMVCIIFAPLYNKFRDKPIIRSVEDLHYPIENIDFPAVTICSNNKVNFWFFLNHV